MSNQHGHPKKEDKEIISDSPPEKTVEETNDTVSTELDTSVATTDENSNEAPADSSSKATPSTDVIDDDNIEAEEPVRENVSLPVSMADLRQTTDCPTVLQESPIFSEIGDEWKNDAITMYLAQDSDEAMSDALDKIASTDIQAIADQDAMESWINTQRSSQYSLQRGGFFNETLERKDAEWRQSIQSENGRLRINYPGFNNITESNLTGEKAVLHVNALLGLGSLVAVPLWHSGFWVTLKAPHESQILELHRRIVTEKISLGRDTYGMVYSNTSVYYAKILMDFIFTHMYTYSLKCEKEDLPKHISSLDIELLVWGMAGCIWPRGFQYSRSVLLKQIDENKVESMVQHEIKEKIDISKLLWTDKSSLTPWQIKHMTSRSNGSVSLDMVKRYRDEFTRGGDRNVKIREGALNVTLKVPSLDEYIQSGYNWVDSIADMVNDALGLEADENVRNNYINEQGKASSMRQYAHWVKQIDTQSEKSITVKETIENVFNSLSQDDEIRNSFLEEVKKYMSDSQIALIATPVATNEEAKTVTLPRFPHLFPLNAMTVFFMLLVQKTRQIQAR